MLKDTSQTYVITELYSKDIHSLGNAALVF